MPFFQANSPAHDGSQGNWKISNLLRNNKLDTSGGGDSYLALEEGSQPSSRPSSATSSPAHSRKAGINLLPEVVSLVLIFFHCLML